MVDIDILEKRGCSAKRWQSLLEDMPMVRAGITPAPSKAKVKITLPKSKTKSEEAREQFIELIRSRAQQGREYNIINFKTLYALDLLWDTPFRQVSPTLLAGIIDKYSNHPESLKSALKSFNLNLDSVLVQTKDPKSGETIKAVDVPAFFTVMVPLVRAYSNSRRARLVNDRNNDPLIPLGPAFHNEEYRTKTTLASQRIEMMNRQYNYLEAINQSVHQMLLYSNCLMFTREEWHSEEQERYNQKGKIEKHVVREGLRYHHTHPSRAYWDRSYPIKSFLTDTGCSWAGHWQVMRFGEIRNTKGFYNTDRITFGNNAQWWSSASTFFQSVYSSCQLSVPEVLIPTSLNNQKDRDTYLAENQYYTSLMDDKSCVLTEHRQKFIPSEVGLGDYDCPIWGRFTLAGDGTVIYAAPIGYTPIIPFKDNGDEKRMEEASQALQLAPYQDMLGNLLTQYIYCVKQNLANVTMLDETVLDKKTLEKIQNLGANYYQGLNLIGFDGKKLVKAQNSVTQAFYSHRFPQMDVNAIITAMRLVIDLAERVLQFSSQEVGQAATHEQTKAEVTLTHGANTSGLDYTGIPVDQAMSAMGRQQYEAWMNYGEDEFTAELPLDSSITEKELSAMGITIQRKGRKTGDRHKVKVKKTALEFLTFAFAQDRNQRTTDVQEAQALATWMRDLMQNPVTSMAIGPEQAIMIANGIAKLAGLRLAHPLVFTGRTPEQQQEESKQMLQSVIQTVLADVKKGMVPIIQRLQKDEQQLLMVMQTLGISPNGTSQNPADQGGSAPTPGMAPALGR